MRAGTSTTTLCRIENGLTPNPGLGTVVGIARAIGVLPGDFVALITDDSEPGERP
jgi:transcriptional regulator with XRE-family HTH domain